MEAAAAAAIGATKRENEKKNQEEEKSKETGKTPEEEEEEDDFDENDLVSAINYNTITSLAALKEILGSGAGEGDEDTTWFQHYFLHHVNRLPSRSQYPEWRRLSECPEEDEDAADDKKKATKTEPPEPPPPPPPPPEAEEAQTTTYRRRSGRESPLALAHLFDPPFPPLSPRGPPPTSRTTPSPLQSPHLDKRFFDVSLIEMKSQASSSSTLDYDSTEEVWVRRSDLAKDTARRKRVSRITLSTLKSTFVVLLSLVEPIGHSEYQGVIAHDIRGTKGLDIRLISLISGCWIRSKYGCFQRSFKFSIL